MYMLFPEINPFDTGQLAVCERHTIHYEQVGQANGAPALFLHGGPGVGILPGYRRFFDPAYFRVILPDQRGAGRSTPQAEIRENTTWQLVEDIEKLRKHLGIESWLVMGGSWGSLLALCYAIRHPNRVSGLVLRGVFLGRQRDIDWVYAGLGTARIFPEAWSAFRAPIKNNEDTIAAYNTLLNHKDKDIAQNAALQWAKYATATMTFKPNPGALEEMTQDHGLLPLARLECHYQNNKLFLPTPNFVLENIAEIRDIKCHIIHGRFDAICDVGQAFELHKQLPHSVIQIVEDGAHSPMEQSMANALVTAINQFKH